MRNPLIKKIKLKDFTLQVPLSLFRFAGRINAVVNSYEERERGLMIHL